MNNKRVRVTAGILGAFLMFTAADLTTYAVEIDGILPAAGLGLSLEEGVSVKEVAEEKGLDVYGAEITIVEPVKPSVQPCAGCACRSDSL